MGRGRPVHRTMLTVALHAAAGAAQATPHHTRRPCRLPAPTPSIYGGAEGPRWCSYIAALALAHAMAPTGTSSIDPPTHDKLRPASRQPSLTSPGTCVTPATGAAVGTPPTVHADAVVVIATAVELFRCVEELLILLCLSTLQPRHGYVRVRTRATQLRLWCLRLRQDPGGGSASARHGGGAPQAGRR